jgi:hypothetical protein
LEQLRIKGKTIVTYCNHGNDGEPKDRVSKVVVDPNKTELDICQVCEFRERERKKNEVVAYATQGA